ncbi:hypothetical protein [Chryseobacterium tongliaoense]|uniref:hypothetical protein n=1 Tax=Chryseobacterium tongliaoense TaxID=3240933 RepID=UPI003513448C
MKRLNLIHTPRYALVFLMTALLLGFVTSCKDDNDDPSPSTHKVVLKAIASSGSNLQTAVYGVSGNPKTVSLSGTTWISEEMIASEGTLINAVVNGVGANTSSTLKVQVWIDGVMKKEESGLIGTTLSTSIINYKL